LVARKRVLLRPGWLLLHVVIVAAAVAMVLLGRWQLTVSEHKHFSLQNFGYALQWWLFSLFLIWMWLRVMRDALRRDDPAFQAAEPVPAAGQPVAYRRYVMPSSAPVLDAEQAAYNDYLARLAEQDEAKQDAAKKGTAR
jgi:DNA-binding transcriptional regulator of glucitol operon